MGEVFSAVKCLAWRESQYCVDANLNKVGGFTVQVVCKPIHIFNVHTCINTNNSVLQKRRFGINFGGNES